MDQDVDGVPVTDLIGPGRPSRHQFSTGQIHRLDGQLLVSGGPMDENVGQPQGTQQTVLLSQNDSKMVEHGFYSGMEAKATTDEQRYRSSI